MHLILLPAFPQALENKLLTFTFLKAQLDKAVSELNEKVRILDNSLYDQDYILGDWYSIVDTHLWATVRWLTYMGLDLAAFPSLAAWKKKIEQRPAIQRLQQQ
jgi:glutathione S-transferase